MACPNINDSNWKAMVEGLGELGAYAVFYETGMPDLVQHSNYKANKGKISEAELVTSTLQILAEEEATSNLGIQVKQKTDDTNRNFHLIENKRLRITKLNGEITRAKNKKQITLAEKLLSERDTLEDEIVELQENDKIELTIEKGYADLSYISAALKKGNNISDSELDMIYKTASLWAKSASIFLGPEEKVMLGIQLEKMHEIAGQATDLLEKVNTLMRDNLEAYIKQSHGKGNFNELQEMIDDISWQKGQMLDISRIADDHIAYLFMSVKKANTIARSKAEETIDDIDKLSKPLLKRFTKKELYDKLSQKYSDGNLTGSLITNVSPEFQEEKFKRRQAYLGLKNKNDIQFTKAKMEYVQWLKDNEISMDVRKLFGNKEGKEEHIEELKSVMGEAEFLRKQDMLEQKVKEYEELREAMVAHFEATEETSDDALIALENWDVQNSPFIWAEYLENPSAFKAVKPNGSKNTYSIPKDKKWYDSRFEEMSKDKELMAYYNYVMKTLKDLSRLLPADKREELRSNSIPFVEKDIAEKFDEDGFRGAGKGLFGTFMKSIRTKEASQTFYGYQDPVTEEDELNLMAPNLEDRSKVNEALRLLKIEYKQENGVEPTPEVINKLYKEARIAVANSKSMDLNKILGAYALQAQSYYHKAAIEDQVRLLKRTINQKLETEKSNGNDVQRRGNQGVKYKSTADSFKYAKAATGSFIDTVFYQKGHSDEGVTNKDIYTQEEKEEIAKLDKLLENENLTVAEREFLENKKKNIGGKLSKSKVGDKLLQWVQMKGMGYNFLAGITNLAFGHVSNFTHAAGAEDYSMKEYMKGWTIALNTLTGKNNTQGRKVINLMKKFDVLKESSDELGKNNFTKAMKNWGPYMVNRRTEIMNQSPIMIAMMMNEGIWEDFDEDGNFTGKGSYGSVEGADFNRFKTKMDQVVKSLHGNYDPDASVMGKEKWAGRALLQFRGWMAESFANRFEDEKYDRTLGRLRKGRYMSYKWEHRKVFPALKDFHAAFTGGMENEVDAANMRKNAVELSVFFGVVALMMMLSGDGEDEEDSKYRNMLINQLLRVKTDLTFYISPMSFEALTKQSVPAMSIVSDSWSALAAAVKFFAGEDELKSGPSAGDSRLLRETLQLFPFLNQVPRWKSVTGQQYD